MVVEILLAAAVVLLVIQSVRLHHRNREFRRVVDGLTRQEPMAALGMLLAGIAHELMTPLGAIASSLDTRRRALDKVAVELARVPDGGDRTTGRLVGLEKALKVVSTTDAVLDAALERTGAMVRQLRLAARGEQEERTAVDVNALVEGALELLRNEFKHGIQVTSDLGDVPAVPGRAGPLGSVVLNLLVNACQAMGETGTVTIATSRADRSVLLTVSDTGPGLPPGADECLFNPGWTTKGEDEGTGLGLFISRRIIEEHGGAICASGGPDGGAVFTVSLPTAAEKGAR